MYIQMNITFLVIEWNLMLIIICVIHIYLQKMLITIQLKKTVENVISCY